MSDRQTSGSLAVMETLVPAEMGRGLRPLEANGGDHSLFWLLRIKTKQHLCPIGLSHFHFEERVLWGHAVFGIAIMGRLWLLSLDLSAITERL